MSLPKLLLIDDDPAFLALFQEKNRYWSEVDTRDESITLFRDMDLCRSYDALIVDLHMPGVDGLNLCYKAKQNFGSRFPVFILSQDQDDKSKVLGLRLKVDDYLTKNMSWEEIGLRIRNRLHRHRTELDGLVLDEEKLEIQLAGIHISVTRVEMGILGFVLQNSEKNLTRQDLMARVWAGRVVVAHTLNSHLHNLNGKLKSWRWQIRIDRDGIVGLQPNVDFKNESLNKAPSGIGR